MPADTERTLPRSGGGSLWKRPWRDWALFLVIVGPNLALLGVFTYRPLIENIRLSFYDWNISSDTISFLGFDNYIEWFTRDDTRTIVANTVIFTVAAVLGSMVIGLALALLLDRTLRGRNLVRSVVFAPFVISGAAIGIAFQFVFDPNFGLVRDLMHRFGLGSPPDFYQDPHWALFMITVTYLWKNVGYAFVIYLAALQGRRRTSPRPLRSTARPRGRTSAACWCRSCVRRPTSCPSRSCSTRCRSSTSST